MIDNTFMAQLKEAYPESKCNLLVPLTIQPELEPEAIPTLTAIRVDPDHDSSDVHAIEGRLALAKPVLFRLGAAAGIQWNSRESGRIIPSVCQFCQWKKCNECEYFGRVFAYRAVGGLQYPDGTFHPCVGEYELDLSDKRYQGKVSRSDAPKRAETGAYERAVRQALAIKSSYKKEQLQKPFVVVGLRYRLDEEGRRMQQAAALTWQYGSVEAGKRELAVLPPTDLKTEAISRFTGDDYDQVDSGDIDPNDNHDELRVATAIKDTLYRKSAGYRDGTITERQIPLLNRLLSELVGEDQRKRLLYILWQVQSSKDLSLGQAAATITWAQSENAPSDWEILYRAHILEQGQQTMEFEEAEA